MMTPTQVHKADDLLRNRLQLEMSMRKMADIDILNTLHMLRLDTKAANAIRATIMCELARELEENRAALALLGVTPEED